MTRTPFTSTLLALVLSSGLAVSAAHALDQNAAPAKSATDASAARLIVPTHAGPRAFLVDAPDAPSSPASRDDSAEPDEHGKPRGQTTGFRLTARVIIRAKDPKAVAAALGPKPAVKLMPAAPAGAPTTGELREFHYADAPTIRAAIALADTLARSPGIDLAYLDIEWPKTLRNNIPTDPFLVSQWHLINTATPAADTNADAAWKSGFTGAGVTVGILEGGWDSTHEDLAPNFDAAASQSSANFSDHGTSTAGLVAAAANNAHGGAGVAWGAHISKQFYGTASEISAAFGFANDINDIKSNSWGPFDNGRIAAIDPLELAAIQDAATAGRDGKGVIIVWAGGNGGQNNNDRVDYDPYASNRYAIAVGSIDAADRKALYSEPGSALMVVTTSDYDINASNDVGIFTTSSFNGYTTNFGGTSAAAPIAAGICALVLDANPELTRRDVQHVLIRSARRCNPADPSWRFNGAGTGQLRMHSDLFGFGALDAGAATTLAQSWVNRPVEASFVSDTISPALSIPDNNTTGITTSIVAASPLIVERAQVTLTLPHPSIGNLRIRLISPSGTEALLAAPRFDSTVGGYNNFTFTAVKFWDERAAGSWTLRIADETAGNTGTLTGWQLKLHGYVPTCPCDWDLSGGAPTLQDLFDFLTSFFAGRGDFNADTTTSVQDLFDFLDCWFGGCA
ncbi:MAG: S8 family serine peptidase [Phycisphaerales bacterium]|nr:S8 family serine peptidase [Phycisphaerales bacterium]